MNDQEKINKMRGMVLAAAGSLARELVAKVEAAQLDTALLEKEIDSGGITWALELFYARKAETVRIQGTPQPNDDYDGLPPFMKQFFGVQDNEASFDFTLPKAWLPAEIPTTMESNHE